MLAIIIPEDVSCEEKRGEKLRKGRTLWPVIYEKLLSKITPEFRDKLENWILNHPRMTNYPNKNYVINISKGGLPNKFFHTKLLQICVSELYQEMIQ